MGVSIPPTVTDSITIPEGEAFAAKFVEAFKAGFAENNHKDTMKDIFAEKCVFDWSDGFKSESTEAMFEQFSKSWGFMVGSVSTEPSVLVDTTNSKIILFDDSFTINITGGFIMT